MSGFPTTPSRDALGPIFENDGEVLHPKKHVSADQLNLWCWQLAGAGITVPRAFALVSSAGDRIAHGAVWNPNGDPAYAPVTHRTSTGLYTVTWAVSYPNEKGSSTAVALLAGKVYPQGATPNLVGVADVVGTTATVRITVGNTGALVDAKFLLEAR